MENHIYFKRSYDGTWKHSLQCWCRSNARNIKDLRFMMGTNPTTPYRWFYTDGEDTHDPNPPKPKTSEDFNDGVDAAWGVLSSRDKGKYGKKLMELIVV